MDIIVKVSDEKIDELIKAQAQELDKDVLKDCIHNAIVKYFEENGDKLIAGIFTVDETNYYSNSKMIKPSPLLLNILKDLDYSKLQPVMDKMIESFSKDYRKIMIEAVTDTFIKGLTYSNDFIASTLNIARQEIWDKENSNNKY